MEILFPCNKPGERIICKQFLSNRGQWSKNEEEGKVSVSCKGPLLRANSHPVRFSLISVFF